MYSVVATVITVCTEYMILVALVSSPAMTWASKPANKKVGDKTGNDWCLNRTETTSNNDNWQ